MSHITSRSYGCEPLGRFLPVLSHCWGTNVCRYPPRRVECIVQAWTFARLMSRPLRFIRRNLYGSPLHASGHGVTCQGTLAVEAPSILEYGSYALLDWPLVVMLRLERSNATLPLG